MLKFVFIIFLVMIVFYFIQNKIHIKIKTFFQRGYIKKESKFGVYCYVGKQGKGKTQNAYSFLLENKDKRIYANMKSIKGIHYKYFNGLDELLNLRDESNCIIFYDEIFKIMTKGTKFNEDIMDFLSQMRKREIIFITTAQEWLEIPITLRRYCRFMVDCSIKSIFGYPIIIKRFGDAENMKWDNLENEYVCPIIETVIEHGRKKIILGYDTYEQIPSCSVEPTEMYQPLSLNNDFLETSEDLMFSEVEEDSPTSENVESDEVVSEITITTTNSNLGVMSQLTNIDDKKCQIHTDDDLPILPSIDKDFWNDIKNDDFTNTSLHNSDSVK